MMPRWAREAAAHKRAQREHVQLHAPLLVPGLWRLTPRRVARHWRRREPLSLRSSVHGASRIREKGTRYRIWYLLASLTPPWTTWVRGRAAATRQAIWQQIDTKAYSVLSVNKYGDVILLDPPREALRIMRDQPVDDEYVRLREALARHLATPRFEVVGDGWMVSEEFVDGLPVSSLSPSLRRESLRQVLRDYAQVCRHESQGNACEAIRESIEATLTLEGVDAELAARLKDRQAALLQRAMQWPMAPAHNDLFPTNLTVREGRPVLLDFQSVALQPFFFDPLYLCEKELARLEKDAGGRRDHQSEAGLGSVATLVEQHFSAEFIELYVAAGVRFDAACLRDTALAYAAVATLRYIRMGTADLQRKVNDIWARARTPLDADPTFERART